MIAWSVPSLWRGETAFILAGGVSLAGQDTQRLEGRRTIAINSSDIAHPWADYLYSADYRWLFEHKSRIEKPWRDRIVTTTEAVDWPGMLHLRKVEPPVKGHKGGLGLSRDPRAVAVRRTSLQGAINLAVLLGAARLVLLGADGGPDKKGRTQHHAAHRWARKNDCWKEQRWDLSTTVAPLLAAGVEVLNASPGSHLDLWPIVPLDEILALEGDFARGLRV